MTIVIRVKGHMTEEQEQWFHTMLNDFESWGIEISLSMEVEETTDAKICPLRPIDCMKEECPWWTKAHECVITNIARCLDSIARNQ